MYSYHLNIPTENLQCLLIAHTSSVSASGGQDRYFSPFTQSYINKTLADQDLMFVYLSQVPASGSASVVSFQKYNNLDQMYTSSALFIPYPYTYTVF